MSATTTELDPCLRRQSSTTHKPFGRGRWNPWKALHLEHRGWKVITGHELPKNIMGLTVFDKKTIWLCSTANELEQTATLAHEVVHVERGPLPRDKAAAVAEERIVEEIAAMRLIPFRDLAHALLTQPLGSIGGWSSLLHVDCPTLHVRLLMLTPTERAALTAVRGGPIPCPNVGLWDDDAADPRQTARDGLAAVSRRRCGTCAAGGAE